MQIRVLILSLLSACALTAADRVALQVLQTTDMHGHLLAWDYTTAKPAANGLSRIATLIQRERAANPHTLLVDTGDTIQGSPLEGVYQSYVTKGAWPLGLKPSSALNVDPMIAAMNLLHYDAMAVGNHEYNYGLKNLTQARNAATFPWLSANTEAINGSVKPFDAYLVKTIAGLKVALIGVTTPSIPSWEKPENYAGYRFTKPTAAVNEAIKKLQASDKPDVILVIAHSGLDRDLRSGRVSPGNLAEENAVYQIAQECPGVTAILFGHTHRELSGTDINGVTLVQARNWAASLGKLSLDFEKTDAGWKLIGRKSETIRATEQTPEDPALVALGKPYHDLAERYLETPVATSAVAVDGETVRFRDSVLVDAIHETQLEYGHADVSLTALFNPRMKLPGGKVTVREIAALYPYENELYVIEATGKILRQALENAANYFAQCPDPSCTSGPLTKSNIPGFNFDNAQGVTYQIDLREPEGQRIKNLTYHGKPLLDGQLLRLAINNYRYGGSGGYTMFPGTKVVYRSGTEIRDLMIEHFTKTGHLPASADNNWQIIPESALSRP